MNIINNAKMQKYVHKQSKMESQRNAAYIKNIKKKKKKQQKKQLNRRQHNTDDSGQAAKQWVKRWGMYRWAGEASTQVKKVSSNNGYEAEGKAFWYNIS